MSSLPELAGPHGIFTDGDWVESKDQDPNGDVRLIQLADIGDGYYRDRSSRFLTSDKAVELNCTFLEPGDVLISRLADPLGRACVFPGDRKQSVTVVDVAVFRTGHTEAVSHTWLKSCINSDQIRGEIDRRSSGTTRKRISRKNLGSVEVPLPPFNEQKRIVAKIEALQARSDAAKEALDAIPPLLEKFRQSVLAAAFRGDLTKKWREQNPDVEPATELLERIRKERRRRWIEDAAEKARAKAEAKAKKAGKPWTPADDTQTLERERTKAAKKYKAPEPANISELPSLPLGWCWASIDEAAFVTKLAGFEYTKYVNYTSDGDLAVIKAENAGREGFVRKEFSYVKSDSVRHLVRSAVQAGDVLMVFVGAGIGKVASVPADQRYFLGPNIALIRPTTQNLFGPCLEQFLRSPLGKTVTLSFAKATAQGSLSMRAIRKIAIPIPPIAEQYSLMERVKSVFERYAEMKSKLVVLQAGLVRTDESILAKAFRGELVPQDPTDEPASVLLDRIRAEREAAEAQKPKRKKNPRPKKAKAQKPVPPQKPKTKKLGPAQPSLPFETDFLEMSKSAQATYVAEILFGHGPLEKDAAIRLAAEGLREQNLANFKRLRKDGALYTTIEKATRTAIKEGRMDRPQRGHLRAIKTNPKDYIPEDWHLVITESVEAPPNPKDEPATTAAIHTAANWAAQNLGLEFKRIPKTSTIHTALTKALKAAHTKRAG